MSCSREAVGANHQLPMSKAQVIIPVTVMTTQVGRLSAGADAAVVGRIAKMYTAGPSFPGQFAQANDFAHRWLFTDGVGSALDAQGRWVIDFAPLLSDAAFAQTLRDYNIAVPTSIPIPLTDNGSGGFSGSSRVPWCSA